MGPEAPNPVERDAGLAAILADFPEVAAAWLFGSRARGDARQGSDLDLGLLLRARSKTAQDVYERNAIKGMGRWLERQS